MFEKCIMEGRYKMLYKSNMYDYGICIERRSNSVKDIQSIHCSLCS